MRLIDADALCRSLTDWQYGDFARAGHEVEYDLLDEVLAGVGVATTIDAVPVVRCEQCKEWIPGTITKTDDFIPPRCAWLGKPMHAADYCSYGERKDGADNG